MIRIKKFENIRGIKRLINPELIDGDTIIYAPNGVMKSSFSKGLTELCSGIIPNDIFANPIKQGVFELENNGDLINNSNFTRIDNVIVFNDENFDINIPDDEHLSELVLSKNLKADYSKIRDRKNKINDNFADILYQDVLKRKRKASDSNIVESLFGVIDSCQVIKKLPDLSIYQDNDLDFEKIFNNSTEIIIDDPDFKVICQDYKEKLVEKLNKDIFNDSFTLDNLSAVSTALTKQKFFLAGHTINLGKYKDINEQALNQLIEETINNVYNGENIEKRIKTNIKAAKKNKKVEKLMSLIDNDPSLIAKLADPEYKLDVIYGKLSRHNDYFNDLKKEIIEIEKDINNLKIKASNEQNTWKNVLNNYKNRFLGNKLNIEITNPMEAGLDLSFPKYKRTFNDTGADLDDEKIKDRFSSGELRSILILNLLYEIELHRGEKITLVLDDIADSFDYKNKYAIVEYIEDFINDPNIQVIILTHNFEFYRSINFSSSSQSIKRLVAYKDLNGDTVLQTLTNHDYFGYDYIKNWRNSNDATNIIALIPFLRNITEIQFKKPNTLYSLLTDCLHYSKNTEAITFSKISQETYKQFPQFNLFSSNDKYIDLLKSSAKKIIAKKPNENNLRDKVILGIFLRVFTDKFMIKKITEAGRSIPAINFNGSRILYNSCKDLLSLEEKEIIQNAMVASPSFVHLNSFAIEPLIDVGIHNLIEFSKKIMVLNSI